MKEGSQTPQNPGSLGAAPGRSRGIAARDRAHTAQRTIVRPRLRKVVQCLVLVLFLYLFFGTRADHATVLPADTFFRLDPLAALAGSLAARWIIGTLLVSLLVIAATLLLGRVWCGWLCPMGTVLDLARFKGTAGERPSVAPGWRGVKYGLLLVIVVAAALGNLTLMILDPITLLVRTLATVVLPIVDAAVTAVEPVLYAIPFLRGPVIALDSLVRGPLLPFEPRTYQLSLLIAVVFGGVIALNLVAHRFWCRALCPLGALLGIVSRLSPLRRRVGPECIACGRCARECPTGAIDPRRDYASDPAECIVCTDCEATCPTPAIRFPLGRPAGPAVPAAGPTRRQALGALAVGALGVSLARIDPAATRVNPYLIRPPGGRENLLAGKCIRCGLCLKVCPTGGLQPAFAQDGWSGLWTPALVSRLGYCDYSCHACGDVCPTGAIPALDLETKRTVVIGKAYLDEARCIPWADGRSCIVCEEMCPMPDKAIKLEKVKVANAAGQVSTIGRPYVERERCIGCGICEYACPLVGEAAIRVRTPTDLEPAPGI